MKKVLAAIVGIAVVALLGWTHRDQIEVRYNCAGKFAAQTVTQQVVPGAYDCIDPDIKFAWKLIYGIDTAQKFAVAWGIPAKYHPTVTYLGKTNDGGYTFRLDAKTNDHNIFVASWNDIKANFPDVKTIVEYVGEELNGNTQGNVSAVETIYLYPDGIHGIGLDGKIYDYSGLVSSIV